ncbi:unnamed protein product [Parascedosporium putredinis]|uniref:Cytochrome P450 n=1 Tax=Parascedosporium putredinis TaxID=1442378 RepID=A0A9P1GXT9_9PEZI|nr:unnamed protein product [Parascedosporium putredinis]CAI7990049.1 unnamed protein product [Parascedosporium putredinis]
MPSVVEVPKKVAAATRDGGGQTVTLDGRTVLLPEGTAISLVAVAAHRNPRYWPTTRSRVTRAETDLDDYVPARWFRRRPGHSDDDNDKDEDEEEGGWERLRSKSPGGEGGGGEYENDEYDADMGGYAGPDTSARLFRPERGAYIPFSDGARSCLGRRIAQVEIVAALAVLFQRYSLELDVGDFETGEGETRDREGLAKLYGAAQERCRKRIEGATSVLTLKMQGGEEDVPVRLVRRGRRGL